MATLFALLVALIHVYVFSLESLTWGTPATNRLFRVGEGDAAILRKMAFNQGFYNLFLAIAIVVGLALRLALGRPLEGNTLVDYAVLSVFGAGAVLFASDPRLKRPALIQALPALGYFGFRLLGS